MNKIFSDKVIVSIDIGTTKICVLVAKHVSQNEVQILAIGKAPSNGLHKGVVVDIAKTVQSVKDAVKEAEFISGYSIESAVVGISGSHILSFNSSGAVPIKKGGGVREYDIISVLNAAKAIPIPEGQQILHVLPQYYSIDSQLKIQNPLGMHGIRLEAQVHIITGSVSSVQNIVRCCEMAGIKVIDIILEQLASADAVLSKDEMELGVAVLDIGGGTSDFAVYYNESIRHTMVLPIAGNLFTNDIAIGLQTTINDAERIKLNYGLTSQELLCEDQEIEIEMVQGHSKRHIQRSYLIKIIRPRAEELLMHVYEEIQKYNLKPFMTTGLVLTGGGALLKGMQELAQEIFKIPVRIGSPKTENILPGSIDSPIYATGYGLLLHTIIKQNSASMDKYNGPLAAKIFLRMKSWVSDFF